VTVSAGVGASVLVSAIEGIGELRQRFVDGR
jgi:hypothetical protein